MPVPIIRKKLKNGKTNTHVYYGCTKVRDRNCQCGYINETDLLRQLEKLIDKVGIDEIGIREKLQEEVRRFKKFQQMLLDKREEIIVKEIDVRNYAKYLLREGTDTERRELLACLKGKIVLNQKCVTISN